MKKNFLLLSILFIQGLMLSSCATTPRGQNAINPSSQDFISYVSLADVAQRNKITVDLDMLNKRTVLTKKGHFLSIKLGDLHANLDGENIRFSLPPMMRDGEIWVPTDLANLKWWQKKDAQNVSKAFSTSGKQGNGRRIILDAGHGGKDAGAEGNGMREKELVLEITQRLKEKLEGRGFDVVMTRDYDKFVPLPDRSWMGNKIPSDLFVSIHANSSDQSQVSGFEIYHVPMDVEKMIDASGPFPARGQKERLPSAALVGQELTKLPSMSNRREGQRLAGMINDAVVKSHEVRSRGVKKADFFVLKWIDKPSVLIELGFLTNANEAHRLNSYSYQNMLTEQITNGISRYCQTA